MGSTEDRLTRLEALVGGLAQRNEQLESDNAAWRERNQELLDCVDQLAGELRVPRGRRADRARSQPIRPMATPGPGPAPTAVPEPSTPTSAGDDAVDRRQLLRRGLAAAGAAAAGAVILDAAPAAAAPGDPVLMGRINVSALPVVIQGGGMLMTGGTVGGLGVGVALDDAHLNLRPGDRYVPVVDTTHNARGDVVMDRFGTLWLCVVEGTPGTWRTLAGMGASGPSAGAFYPIPPTRVYDSRPGSTPAQGPKSKLSGNVARTVSLANASGPSLDNVATVYVVNLLLVNAASGDGNLTVWANGASRPQANTLVWGGSAGRHSTLAYVKVDAQSRMSVAASLATDLVVDVLGFYA